MRSPCIHLLVGCAIAGAASYCFALQPLITDDTGTQGRGGNQLELSLTGDRSSVGGALTRTSIWDVVFTRGLTDRLDVFVGASHLQIRTYDPAMDTRGTGNPMIGLKWRLIESEGASGSFALKPEIGLPVSQSNEAGGFGTGKTSFALTGIYTRQVPFGDLHVNLTFGRERYRNAMISPDATTTRFSLAPVWNLDEQWKLVLDVGVVSKRAGDENLRSSFIEMGTIYSPNADFDLAFGLVRAANNADPRETVSTATTGITWRFK